MSYLRFLSMLAIVVGIASANAQESNGVLAMNLEARVASGARFTVRAIRMPTGSSNQLWVVARDGSSFVWLQQRGRIPDREAKSISVSPDSDFPLEFFLAFISPDEVQRITATWQEQRNSPVVSSAYSQVSNICHWQSYRNAVICN